MSGQPEKLSHNESSRHITSRYCYNFYRNGLKFERDRAFHNSLMGKVIFLMIFLLIVVAVSCTITAKHSGVDAMHNKTTIIKYLNKAEHFSNDEDIENTKKVGEIFYELKTAFIPRRRLSFEGIHQVKKEDVKKTKYHRRHADINRFESIPVMADTKVKYRYNEAVDVEHNLHTRNQSKSVYEDNAKIKESQRRHDHGKDLSVFWRKEMNKNNIRALQAERMLSFMDPTTDPCEDFYQYACGNWEKKNPIPEDKVGFDTFEMLRESLDSNLKDLLLEPINEDTPEAERKAKEFFESCMNEEILEKRGNEPLHALSRTLRGWPMITQNWNSSDFDWLELTAQLRLYNNDIFLTQWVGPDIRSSSNYIVQFDQTSLGLPTRDYYIQPSNAAYLAAYKAYIIQVAVLLGAATDNATTDAEDLISFETRLARITSGADERRNISELYVKMALSRLKTLVPQIDWLKYLTIVLGRKVDAEENVVVFALKYYNNLAKLIESSPPRTVANYLFWRFMRHRVNYLGKEFQNAKQDFYFVMFGREKSPPRWTVCVSQVNANMGLIVGSMFVKRYFDEFSKNDTVGITRNIMHSFEETLNSTEWIGEKTKIQALRKVNAMILRIGYPDFILNENELNERYLKVNISRYSYFENSLNLIRHLARTEFDRLGTKVNKTQWNTAPAVVNAYYSRNKNQIMFPAGILQPPFYHKYFPKSLNYGGIGVVIGHEITHGFDDRGKLFDEHGNLDQWWDEEASEEFHQRAKCLIDQYSSYTIRDVDIRINGVHTQGENIADNGGIKQAYKAYKRWLEENDATDEFLPGVNATNFQLFFLNFAQVWCGIMRPEASKNKLKTAVHSPGKFRVTGTLSNLEEFSAAFNCLPNSTMNLSNKCKVW